MSDTQVTRSSSRTGTDHNEIRISGVAGTYHANASEILAQRGSQRAARAVLSTPTPDPHPTAPATGKAPTVETTPPTAPARRTTSLTTVPASGRPPRKTSRLHLTLAELCEDLGISRSTFYDWRAKRKAPRCLKLPNGDLRIRRSDYENWLASLEEEAA
jgi:predicted DNA-binding transcriptional regulator AlpA